MKKEQAIILFIAVFFGCLAALTAYIIAYKEYCHHFPEKRRVRRLALESAIFAFAFYCGLGILLAILLPKLLQHLR
jgi:amino acid permease